MPRGRAVALLIFIALVQWMAPLSSGPMDVSGFVPMLGAVVSGVVLIGLAALEHHRRHQPPALYSAWRNSACAAGAGALTAIAFHTALDQLDMRSAGLDATTMATPGLTSTVALGAFIGLVNAGLWTLAFDLPKATERAQIHALEANNLRLEAAQLRVEGELSRLRMQIEPHFLLNTLNTVAALVGSDPAQARRLIGCLGEIFRDALDERGPLRTVAEEVAWSQRYVQILEARHGDALQVRWQVHAAACEALVPRLLLQPLIENAVHHGVLQRDGGGTVIVYFDVDGNRLRCRVTDDGPGVDPHKSARPGSIGIAAVERRLALEYGTEASFCLFSSEGETTASVELPLTRRATAA